VEGDPIGSIEVPYVGHPALFEILVDLGVRATHDWPRGAGEKLHRIKLDSKSAADDIVLSEVADQEFVAAGALGGPDFGDSHASVVHWAGDHGRGRLLADSHFGEEGGEV